MMKHGVRRRKETAEDDEEWKRDGAAQRRGAGMFQPATARQLAPRDVAPHELEYADPRADHALEAGPNVLPRMAAPECDPLQAQAGDGQDDGESDRVQQVKHGRRSRHEVRADEERCHREPQGVRADGDPVPTHEAPPESDERGGADECVETPRQRPQQHITGYAEQGRTREGLEAEFRRPTHGAHPAAASGSPPNRRSRA